MNFIHGSGKHLLGLINDILDLSKVESGTIEIELTPIKIANLLEQSLTMIREKCAIHDIALELNLSPAALTLELNVDERRLKQVMYNLLSNANKFTPDGGTITINADQKDGRLQVSITDTGIGLSAENLNRVFDEFFQVESGLTDKTPGTGLGLPLTRRIIELHGGEIRVESECEGKGSCFTFTMPIDLNSVDDT